ncbi:TonB-dependent receptor [Sphingobium sp. B1D7B]|uniref:TonB-dependent receptor n=1 Tax=unclassified Sphingobium TaxID=2611147 RepID=UPI0022243B28|nr:MULTISPECIES: TonB-dependent receptor [unclassified Sphingobium]MCW2393476.1 TonB-dependent receptor [Sphingobium sp. B11D3A]MCW2405413.1 TonB-dependent receptor [Sphingobium sp. B1D7B]
MKGNQPNFDYLNRPAILKAVLLGAPSALALIVSAPAMAQSSAAPQSASTEDIIVTGYRASLQQNLDIKRESAGVVEAISAEDIGKFPDPNVAAALQRLPGVSVQRNGRRGEADGVTIRGFGGDFIDTLVDGRHISTAIGNRGVDFTTIGSDFVGRLNVYKTPNVELSTSAIGGFINVEMPKPFDRPGFQVIGRASGSYQSRSKDVTPSAGLLISNTFADDTIGILGNVNYKRTDTTSNRVFVPGWIGANFAPCQAGPNVPTCTPTSDATSAAWATPSNRNSVLNWFPQQTGIEQIHTKDERLDARIALQWQPSDNLLITVDDNFSRQTVHSNAFGYAAWFNGSDLRNVKYDENGTVVDFSQFGTPMDFNANYTRTILETNTIGANVKWDVSENLKLDVDGFISRSTRNPGRNGYNDSMDIGYGGTNAGGTTILGANTGVTILGPSKDYLPQIHDIGPAGNVSRFTDTSVIGSHVIVRGAPYNADTVKQLRAVLRWDQDNVKLAFGGQYMEDKLYGENTSTFSNGVFASRSGYGTPSGRPGGSSGGIAPLPASVYQGIISTANWIPGYQGNLGPSVIVYDPYQVYKLLEASGGSVAPTLDPASVYEIREKTYAIFFRATFDTDLGGMPFSLTAGLRHEGTHLTSNAIGRRLLGLSIPSGDPTLIQPNPALGTNGFSDPTTISRSSNYTFLLPSLDAKLEVMPNLLLRMSASRTLTRPGLAALRPTVTLGTLRVGSLSASGGNPDLKPYLSDNFDAAAEWYYQRNSYVSANFYLKHITNFVVGGVSVQSIDDAIDPSTGRLARFNVNSQVNGPEATVKGVEIAVQHVFGESGFGFQANATFPWSNRNYDPTSTDGSAFSITGLAKSANLIAFYDKDGFQIRGALNWRDEYLVRLGQDQGGTFGAEPVYVDQQLQIDASASYDVTPFATVFVEANNLNNSTYSTHGRFSNQTLDVFSYGRRFSAGVRVKY